MFSQVLACTIGKQGTLYREERVTNLHARA